MSIKITNQSDSAISGLRLRLDDVYSLWGIDITGDFLRKNEADSFKDAFTYREHDTSVIFPELPTIPASSSVELSVYARLGLSKPNLSITTLGNSYSIINIVEVEDGLLVEWYLNPLKYVPLIIIFLPVALLMLSVFWTNARKRIVKNETKNILYNNACELAKEGNPDEAMILLRKVVRCGLFKSSACFKGQ